MHSSSDDDQAFKFGGVTVLVGALVSQTNPLDGIYFRRKNMEIQKMHFLKYTFIYTNIFC